MLTIELLASVTVKTGGLNMAKKLSLHEYWEDIPVVNSCDTPLTEEQLKDIQFSEKYTNYYSRDDLYQLECDSMFTKTLRNIPEKDIKFYDIVFSKRLNKNEGFIRYNFILKKYQVGYFFNEDFSYKKKVQDVLKLI